MTVILVKCLHYTCVDSALKLQLGQWGNHSAQLWKQQLTTVKLEIATVVQIPSMYAMWDCVVYAANRKMPSLKWKNTAKERQTGLIELLHLKATIESGYSCVTSLSGLSGISLTPSCITTLTDVWLASWTMTKIRDSSISYHTLLCTIKIVITKAMQVSLVWLPLNCEHHNLYTHFYTVYTDTCISQSQ